MKPGDPLFTTFVEKVEAVTPRLFAHEAMRLLTTDTLTYVREYCSSMSLPRLGHHKTALQRAVSEDGLAVPSGKIYVTGSYEDFTLGSFNEDEEAVFDHPVINCESRLLVLTNDSDETKGKIVNALDKIFDERPQHKGVFVIFGFMSPKDTPKVTSVDAIMFAIVQSNSGEAFGFTFQENSNKDKVRATEAMSSEWGEVRERFGHIDTCSVEAIRMTNEQLALIRDELQKANTSFQESRNNSKDKSSPAAKIQSLGQSALTRVKQLRAKKTASV